MRDIGTCLRPGLAFIGEGLAIQAGMDGIQQKEKRYTEAQEQLSGRATVVWRH